MPYGNPFTPELLGVAYSTVAVPLQKTGADTTKTALTTIDIPAYKLQLGAVLRWEAFGQVTLNTAVRNFTVSTELGSFQTYNTTHSRSGSNYGLVYYSYLNHRHSTAVVGNGTFTSGVPDDVSSRQFLPTGATSVATDWWGTGTCVVTAAPTTASVTVRGGGHAHFTGLDQGGTPVPSLGFDTDGNNTGTVNPQISNTFGFYVAWGAPAGNSLDVVLLNGFAVELLGYRSPL
jgi:hypothetical protein